VVKYFRFFRNVQTGSGDHPASYPLGPGECFPRGKRPEHKANYLSPSPVEVKNGGAIFPLPIRLHGVTFNSLMPGDNLTLTFPHFNEMKTAPVPYSNEPMFYSEVRKEKSMVRNVK
jgi:hypothetical protein